MKETDETQKELLDRLWNNLEETNKFIDALKGINKVLPELEKVLADLEKEYLEQLYQNRQRNLLMFIAKWKNVRLPRGIEEKSFKITEPLIHSIHDIWWKAGLRMEKVGGKASVNKR